MQIQNNATYSVVVPLFNEEESLDLLVTGILKIVDADPRFLELVLVDDGSHDATAKLVSDWSARDGRIRLVQHDVNRGLGAAIRTGLAAAAGDLVLYTDADLPFDFSLIPQLVAETDSGCVVTGYRLNRGEGARRWVLTKSYNFMIWLFFGLHLRDVNFACKVLPQTLLRSSRLTSEGSFIDAEIMLESRRLGLRTVEFPLVYFPRERGCSTLSRPAVIVGILKEMFSYLKRHFADQGVFLVFTHNSRAARAAMLFVKSLSS